MSINNGKFNALLFYKNNRILFNCWKTLKIIKLQRKDEISLGVNVMKIKKINYMRVRLNPLLFF